MSTVKGGPAASAGFRYQYLCTVEAMLDALQKGGELTILIEDPGNQTVDYAIEDNNGHRLLSAQVKSTLDPATGSALPVKVLLSIMIGLIRDDAREYRVETNRRLTAGAAALNHTICSSRTWRRARSAVVGLLAGDPELGTIVGRMTATEWKRLRRCRATSDTRSSAELQSLIKLSDNLGDPDGVALIDLRDEFGTPVWPLTPLGDRNVPEGWKPDSTIVESRRQ